MWHTLPMYFLLLHVFLNVIICRRWSHSVSHACTRQAPNHRTIYLYTVCIHSSKASTLCCHSLHRRIYLFIYLYAVYCEAKLYNVYTVQCVANVILSILYHLIWHWISSISDLYKFFYFLWFYIIREYCMLYWYCIFNVDNTAVQIILSVCSSSPYWSLILNQNFVNTNRSMSLTFHGRYTKNH